MRTKTLILGGVAIAGLIGITPALAFTRHPGTQAEHQQTEDLNRQQLSQAQSGTTTQTAAAATEEQGNATSGNAPDQQANAASGSDQMAVPNAAPATAQASATPVDTLANPPQALANASVESNSGQAIGAVQRVITDASGKAETVIVSLLGKVNKLVAIAANQLNFDESRNVVVSQLSADQINALPAAPQG